MPNCLCGWYIEFAEMNEFLVYSTKAGIHQVDLGDKSGKILPIDQNPSAHNIETVDFDYNNNCLYWADSVTNSIQVRFCSC